MVWARADEQRKRRICTRAAFSVICTTGSMKLRKRRASFRHKLSDSGGRFWEELPIIPGGVHFPNDRKDESTSSCVTHLEELEEDDPKSFQMPTLWVPSSKGRHDDIDMEPTNDFLRTSESLPTELMIHQPQGLPRTSEDPKGLGAFAEGLRLVPDYSLFMDVEPSDFAGLLPSPVAAPLPQPLLAEPDRDVVMHDEPVIRKSKEIAILERVGETLRQKKLRATQA